MVSMLSILIVDDDLQIRQLLRDYLTDFGMSVVAVADGQAMAEAMKKAAYDLVILDLMLPGEDGLAMCRKLRAESDVPILMLTARGEAMDRVVGLELGADDYIVKPFSPRQLVARVEAVLRRYGSPPNAPGPLTVGDLTLDTSRCTVFRAGELVAKLTRLECRLLEILLLNRGQVLSTDGLIDHIWGPQGGDRDMLKQLVYRLRRKIEDSPSNPVYIETIPGVGYSLAT